MLLPFLQLLTHKTQPPLYLKFRTSHRENIRYLKAIGILDPNAKPRNLPSPQTVDQVLSTINFLKAKAIHDQDFSRLAFLCPQLFYSTNFDTSETEPVFDFLITDLHASIQESRGLIVNYPYILFLNVEYCLRPTLEYLRELGVEKLNEPNKQKAFLLNTRVEKLSVKIRFLRIIGLKYEEASSSVEEMERSLEEL